MRPPVCEFCGKAFDPGAGGGTVTFADYEPLPDGMVGHPHGVMWFCKDHYDAAHALKDQPSSEALVRLRKKDPLMHWVRRLFRGG